MINTKLYSNDKKSKNNNMSNYNTRKIFNTLFTLKLN